MYMGCKHSFSQNVADCSRHDIADNFKRSKQYSVVYRRHHEAVEGRTSRCFGCLRVPR